jgi:CRISPR-associated DxTHG motif protein
MSTKLLTFLGLGRYEEVTYCWNQHEHKTKLFPEALAKWLEPAEILVLLTAEAKTGPHSHWKDLQSRLGDLHLVAPQPIDIPSGKSEQELWEIFSILTKCLDGQRPVVFDVTHAFRSLPILALLATAYLRVAHTVRLERLLYGAFEARSNGRAPVFDLTPFVTLLDWTAATDKFLKTGAAHELAGLLDDAQRLPWQAGLENRATLPRKLQGLAGVLRRLSQNLSLARPAAVAVEAKALSRRLDEAGSESERWARPFALLLDHTRDTYAPFIPDTLVSQRQLVHWYVEHEHFAQAILLGREWLVSWTCLKMGKDLINEREEVERALNEVMFSKRNGNPLPSGSLAALVATWPEAAILIAAWSPTGDLRNDVAHCGMRPQPRSAECIVQSAKHLSEQLDQLAVEEGAGT